MRKYAGPICHKCGKNCLRDKPISYLQDIYKNQERRYGGYICRECVLSMLTSQEIKEIQSKQIRKEMGL